MKKRLLFIATLFVAWLPILAIQKPLFMAYYHSWGGESSLTDYLQVILHGLKLDCTVAGYLTVIPFVVMLVSIQWAGKWIKHVLKAYFVFAALLVSALFSVDMGLYGFWGFRLDATILFYLQSPADAMASVPVGLFAGLFLFFLLYAFGIYQVLKKCVLPLAPETAIGRERGRPVNGTAGRKVGTTFSLILTGGLLFLAIRGSVTTSTANVGMVYFSDRQFLNHAAINPCFSLMASAFKQQDFAAQFDFFPEEKRKEVFESLVPARNTSSLSSDSSAINQASVELLTTTRPDILVILLESFSANAIEVLGGEGGVTPNLNRLSREGVLFTNMYANSFRTDRGIVSVLNGYLAQPTTSIMKYPAKSQSLPSIAKSLVAEGYTADMLYGGDINFTNMQSYFYSSGYSHITADRDFPLKSRLSKWGANDDITFSHLYESILERKDTARWLSTFLTLSSHEPFEVPFHRLDNPYLNSVAFTDSCIGSFIDRLKETPAWQNLLVILVSDHGFRYPSTLTDYEPARFHIPMLWLGGAVKEPRQIDTFANQTDLVATLLQQMHLSADEFIFSKNILDPRHPHYAYYTFPNGFGFIDSTGISLYNNENNQPLLNAPAEGSEVRLEKGKALLQTLYDDLGRR